MGGQGNGIWRERLYNRSSRLLIRLKKIKDVSERPDRRHRTSVSEVSPITHMAHTSSLLHTNMHSHSCDNTFLLGLGMTSTACKTLEYVSPTHSLNGNDKAAVSHCVNPLATSPGLRDTHVSAPKRLPMEDTENVWGVCITALFCKTTTGGFHLPPVGLHRERD